jgi:tRNA (guanine9-N1)-methyltransferase
MNPIRAPQERFYAAVDSATPLVPLLAPAGSLRPRDEDQEGVEYEALGPSKVVYLAAEGEETMDQVDPTCMYVVGGLVDRNRYKGLCFDKAKALGVRSQRLPLPPPAELGWSGVLTTNVVVKMLVRRLAGDAWPDIVREELPSRKGKARGGDE